MVSYTGRNVRHFVVSVYRVQLLANTVRDLSQKLRKIKLNLVCVNPSHQTTCSIPM